MSAIGRWLEELRLEKYLAVFEQAEIDTETLSELVEDDLRELGLPIGPRRKVLSAIARLRDTRPAETGTATRDKERGAPPASDAERRHLTVMFVDLVGSTAMSTRLDPEDMREVITLYQNTVAGEVVRFEGFVAKYMGDGVLCYFGWPRAHEDDAERAVRAGLAIIDAVKAAKAPNAEVLASRIGIASGVVVVGDLIGSGAAQEAAVVGDTPNLAARLQALAEPDQIVLAAETRAIIANVFELKALPQQELKGVDGAVTAFAVLDEALGSTRFEARQTADITTLVSRDQELALITERWRKAVSGQGQLVLVSGEAGIGKSRMVRALIDTVTAEQHTQITFQCSPYHIGSPLHPIIQYVSNAAGFSSADDNNARLDKLEQLNGVGEAQVALLAVMLGIDAAHRYGDLNLPPTLLRARTLQAITDEALSPWFRCHNIQ